MLTKEEIKAIRLKEASDRLSGELSPLHNQVFDLSIAFIDLKEFIEGLDDEGGTIQPAPHLKSFNLDTLTAGWDECLKTIKAHLKELS